MASNVTFPRVLVKVPKVLSAVLLQIKFPSAVNVTVPSKLAPAVN